MSTVEAILNFTSNLGNMFGNLIQNIQVIGSSIISAFSYVISIFKALFIGLVSLITPVAQLISSIISDGAISSGFDALDQVGLYIGYPATAFIMTLFVIILVRIIIGFVFKILRLNIDYHTLGSKVQRWSYEDQKKSSSLFK